MADSRDYSTMSLEDLALNEVRCYECNKPMPSIPAWLAKVNVKFQCEECRQRHPRVPGMADIEPRRIPIHAEELPDLDSDILDEEIEEELDEELSEVTEEEEERI